MERQNWCRGKGRHLMRLLRVLEMALRLRPKSPVRQARQNGLAKTRTVRPSLESLEDRCVLDVAVDWAALGPNPQQSAGGNVSGRVSALVPYTFDGQRSLLVGTASGGVFRYNVTTRTYTPLTDSVGLSVLREDGTGAGALRVGSIAVDPWNPNIIYVGTGEANYATHYGGTGS